MADNPSFKHLALPLVLQGRPILGGGGNTSAITTRNRNNRELHGEYIKRRSAELSRFWKERQIDRVHLNLPTIETGVPILLEIDPSSDIDFLRGLGFEIVCEIEEGFIIVATDDIDFELLNKKTDVFISNIVSRCNSPAKIYALCEDTDRLSRILTSDLYSKWSSIDDDQVYLIDIGVSCCGNVELPKQPQKKSDEDYEHYADRLRKWRDKFTDAYIIWDELKIKRENIIESFVRAYNCEIVEFVDGSPGFVGLPDSFSARLRINGKCLRDLVQNFAYIFEASESEQINMGNIQSQLQPVIDDVTILSPSPTSPIICVIDSGIQEEHKYISPAILSHDSKSLVSFGSSVSDEVSEGGHGTRVAGAILYPREIPIHGTYELPCWVRNYKVLSSNNRMPMDLYPPKVISSVVEDYSRKTDPPTKIFNHSIGAGKACDLKHMSPWAAEIDLQSYENDVLFIGCVTINS